MTKKDWILLVEDNANDADLTVRALASQHLKGAVVRAGDGAEALDCLHRRGTFKSRASGAPLLILLDLKMPRLDGFEVLRQIKVDAVLKTIPVVVFTSSRERADLRRSYELGANGYVVKPVAFQEFIDALNNVKMFWLDCNESLPDAGPAKTIEPPVIAPRAEKWRSALLPPASWYQGGCCPAS